MPSINDDYRDAQLRHQIGLRGYSAGLVKRVSNLLAEADQELAEMLRKRLGRFEGKAIDVTSERWQLLLEDIREARVIALKRYRELVNPELAALGGVEAARELAALGAVIPFEVNFATVAADQLRAISTSRPFQGQLLKDWYKKLETNDQTRLRAAIQLGMSQGESVDSLVRRLVGTKAQKYTDGILTSTRREAAAIARTAVNHVSNTAREYVFEANEDIIQCRIWHATLDGRTSAVCRARDGAGAPVGDNELPPGVRPLSPPGAQPPAHFNCRSVMVAYIDGVGLLGNRPFIVDTRTPGGREIDFRKEAKTQGIPIQDVRKNWAAANVGRVPAQTTYQEFLSRQSASFQDMVLGRAKGRLFRSGEFTVQDFVDRSGNELSLSQLHAAKPSAFA